MISLPDATADAEPLYAGGYHRAVNTKVDDRYCLGGERVPFAQANPTVKSIRIDVSETGDALRGGKRTDRYELPNVPTHIRCSNPRCQRGGLQLESWIGTLIYARNPKDPWSRGCDGDEGSPAGTRKGMPCNHHFSVEVTIAYTDEPQPSKS